MKGAEQDALHREVLGEVRDAVFDERSYPAASVRATVDNWISAALASAAPKRRRTRGSRVTSTAPRRFWLGLFRTG
jgi:hypothetical protein